MQVHLIARQADAVVYEVAAFDCAQGRVGVSNIGFPLFNSRLWKQSHELVHAACNHPHGGNSFAQLGYEVNAGRAGRTYNRNFHHDGHGPMGRECDR
jgi:hypothetical protein